MMMSNIVRDKIYNLWCKIELIITELDSIQAKLIYSQEKITNETFP